MALDRAAAIISHITSQASDVLPCQACLPQGDWQEHTCIHIRTHIITCIHNYYMHSTHVVIIITFMW